MKSLYKIVRSMFGRENTTTVESPVEGTLQERLYKRWNLGDYILQKSICFSPREGEENDLAKIFGKYDDERIYGEVHPRRIMGLIPDTLVGLLLATDFRLVYDNGAFGNSYDARKNVARVKATNDMLHEIGHGLWYNLIPAEENEKRKAVVESLSEDSSKRIILSDEQIPTMHKQYSELVGAFSGQFLVGSDQSDRENDSISVIGKEYPSPRRNDLEEHFARNFDYLLKGKPLEALTGSTASVDDFLEFYQSLGIIDDEFKRFYQSSIGTYYKGRGVSRLTLDKIVDGDRISTRVIERVARLKESLRK